MKLLAAALLLLTVPAFAQTAPTTTAPDPFHSLSFLKGTWQASGKGNAGVTALGAYTFDLDLKGHILSRHSKTSDCKAPTDFDCAHNDLLYIYPDGQSLKAIYFDNEGHVLHYDVTTPDPTTAIFLTESTQPGPRFRLVYTLQGSVMSGKFQMQPPGQTTWNSYLEWSGPKQ